MRLNQLFSYLISSLLSLSTLSIPIEEVAGQIPNPDVDREVIAMLEDGALDFPEGVTKSTPDFLVIESNVRDLLFQFEVDQVRKAFPDFTRTDTLQITTEGHAVRSVDLSRVYVFRLPSQQSRDSFIDRLLALPQVNYAEPNAMTRARGVPDDTHLGRQWSFQNTGQSGGTAGADIKMVEAWNIFTGSSNVTIGIVDFGRVKQDHPDLAGRVSGNLSTPIDEHSTAVAGIAAAKGGNGMGIAGVDWNALINTQTVGDIPQTATALRNVVDAGADIVNNSWGQGNNNFSVTLKQAFVYAYNNNAISSIAMPEEGVPEDYPNAYGQGIVNVGATTDNDTKAWYSFARNYIDATAPGGNLDGSPLRNIFTTASYNTTFGYYDYFWGTSAAAPHVSGITSLLKGYNPNLYNDDIESIIKLSADKVPGMSGQDWTNEYGYGRVNAHKALLLANSVQHASVTGGSSIGYVNGHTPFYGISGLTDGYNYLTERHEVRTSVTFSPAFQDAPSVWGRGAATTGFNGEDPNFGVGFCEPVPGTITTTGAQIRTFVYDVWVPDINSPDGKGQYMGRFPTDFSNVVLAYSTIEIPTITIPPTPQNLVITNQGQGGQNPQLSWQYSPLSDFDHYNIYRKYESEQNFSLIGTSGSTAYTDLGTTLSSTWFPSVSYYVTAVNQQSAESDPSNTATTGGGPSTLGGENAITQLIPNEYSLLQNYPNPFNPETEIVYGLPEPSEVRIVISDILGRELLTLEEAHQTAGYHRKRWSGVDATGEKLGSGVYLLRIVAKGETGKQFSQVLKLVLTK